MIFLLIFAKVLLGLILSSVLSFASYLLVIAIATSLPNTQSINGLLLTVVAISLGASVGSFISWFEIDRRLTIQLGYFMIILVCCIAGAYLGIQKGIELMPFQPKWEYGLPVLSLSIQGAVLSSNAPMLLIALYKAVRQFRI